MTDPIRCDVHGPSEATLVCEHISKSLKDRTARGFNWALDDDEYQATCDECYALSDDDWDATARDVIQMICLGCFSQAAEINGVAFARRDMQ